MDDDKLALDCIQEMVEHFLVIAEAHDAGHEEGTLGHGLSQKNLHEAASNIKAIMDRYANQRSKVQ